MRFQQDYVEIELRMEKQIRMVEASRMSRFHLSFFFFIFSNFTEAQRNLVSVQHCYIPLR